MAVNLPEQFRARMQTMLGEEYPDFEACFTRRRFRGLRVNTMKITPGDFETSSPFHLRRVPWVSDGFYYGEEDSPAQHPWYASGLYYLQEPSAMTPASRLPLKEGDRVLDLCAAPGGKSTELAARLNGSGLLVSNDISVPRARALLRNLELFGAPNIFVTGEKPENLAAVFPGFFQAILVDAPCSGEGMFRKSQDMCDAWSTDKVAQCAGMQKQILKSAHGMLQPGGHLLYSTCTFSPDEDEQIIAWFIREYPDMQLIPVTPGYEGFRPGHPEWADGNPELSKCVRIWPHIMGGEGHFMALMAREPSLTGVPDRSASSVIFFSPAAGETRISADADQVTTDRKADDRKNQRSRISRGDAIDRYDKRSRGDAIDRYDKRSRGGAEDRGGKARHSIIGKRGAEGSRGDLTSQEKEKLLADFLLGTEFEGKFIDVRGDRAYLAQRLPADAGQLNFLRNGLFIGEWKKGRFEPSQQLALALHDYPRKVDFSSADEQVSRYLRGESLQMTSGQEMGNGWVLVTVDGHGIGWGRLSGSILKNKMSRTWLSRQ